MTIKNTIIASLLGGLISLPAHAELIINTQPSEIISSSTVVTNTQPPSTESAKKLMQVMRVEEQIQTLINAKNIAGEVASRAGQGGFSLPEVDESELTEEQRQIRRRIEQVMAQSGVILGQTVADSLDADKITEAYVTAVQTHYTQSEVNALIAFYDTPTGQSILDKQPQVTQDFLKAALPTVGNKNEQGQQDLSDLMELMQGIFQTVE